MKLDLFNSEANKIWQRAVSKSPAERLQFELDIYKKLLSFFLVGDYYFIIFNVPAFDLEQVSKEIETVLGYRPSDFNMKMMLNIIHIDDRPWFLNYENKVAEFLTMLPVEKLMKYKVRYDFRVQKKDGSYIRILHQCMVIEHDEQGGIVRTLGIHTDITHLKPTGRPVLSLIGLEGEPSYLDIDVKNVFTPSKELLSKREKQVLALLIEGKVSKEIANDLYISKQTVDKHRKNMLYKNKLNNTGELIAKAIKQGWL